MAAGGMGDVLTGLIAGLMAQGYSPQSSAHPAECIGGRFAAGSPGSLCGDFRHHLGSKKSHGPFFSGQGIGRGAVKPDSQMGG